MQYKITAEPMKNATSQINLVCVSTQTCGWCGEPKGVLMDYLKLVPAMIKRGSRDQYALQDSFDAVRNWEREGLIVVDGREILNHDSIELAHHWNKEIRKSAAKWVKDGGGSAAMEIYRKTLLFDAPLEFDAFCRYIELDRGKKKRFYEPRRLQLLPVASSLQDLEDDKLDLLTISEPPGIGKTTIAIFFLAWTGGRHPEMCNIGASHSNSFMRGVYDELLRVMDPNGEYLYKDVFPLSAIAGTNAKDMRIDLATTKRFETFELTSIGSGNAGKIRASNILYCDDLIDGIETAMSKDRLDKLWAQYNTDLRQRKIGLAKELHIATRWSVHDVIGRLERMYEGNERARFLNFSALDENDESNFDYPYNLGFTTQFYREQREIMDEVSWKALYMNLPIEREGQLYSPDELRRYFDLPQQEPDAIIAVCDTKNAGSDYCVMPIAYRYGQDYYIEHIVCDNSNPEIVETKLINALVSHKVKTARFESNSAGGRVAKTVQDGVKNKGGITKITTKWSQSNKETRIIVDSPWVKEHCLFRDKSCYPSKEYRDAISMLTSYNMATKNKHDDVPDAFSMLANYSQSFDMNGITLVKRPF